LQEIFSYSAFFEICLWLSFTLPLLSFLLSFSISEKYSWIVSFTTPLLLLVSAFASAFVFFTLDDNHSYTVEFNWFNITDNTFTIGVLLNNLSATMLVVVTFISFLVHSYSVGYMAGDAGIRRYFAMLGLFTFSMLGIVLADNLLMVFIFWELVGFSSYMLIGHWKEKPEAAGAAKKAFILNRIGDAGFLIGLMILWTHQSSFSIAEISSITSVASWQTAASLCIFCGVIGKSAQFPLLTWLPDAMEGPTPVSALIHAATMVAAGVFLMVRVFGLFTSQALDVVVVAGIITALIGALSALGQYDLKKILAYSTISQLGLMVTGIGAGVPDAAFLHLFTHAFFKACLFLAAGSIIHSLHQAQHQAHAEFDVQDVRNLGGLQKKLPAVFIVFIIAGSSLAGLPFFSGFLSKDAVITGLMQWNDENETWKWLVVVGAFVVTFTTVLYTFRMIWRVFLGDENKTKSLVVSESPVVMQIPLYLLALASFWIVVSWNPFVHTRWLVPTVQHSWGITIFSIAWVLIALITAFLSRHKSLHTTTFANSFYLDNIYNSLVIKPAFFFSEFTIYIDKKWIDGLIHLSAYGQVLLAHITGWVDRAIVDGTVNGMAGMARSIGSLTRSFQDGKIQLYIFWSIFTIIIFLIWTLL
jgi:NADH-quinone oxidoreductase subunit L